jgi:hypothetical protein
MKIDTAKIPNFDTLPDEAKNAILAMEFADAPDMSQYVAKSIFDKKASEAAELGKKLRDRMTEDEVKATKAAEEQAALIAELETLRFEKLVGTYVTAYMSMGFDEKMAKDTAEAMAKGDTDTVFKNQKLHLENREKALRTELLKGTPSPAAGKTDTGMSKEQFSKMTLAEKARFAEENPETYKEFYGGN